jgi:hypothetical protein
MSRTRFDQLVLSPGLQTKPGLCIADFTQSASGYTSNTGIWGVAGSSLAIGVSGNRHLLMEAAGIKLTMTAPVAQSSIMVGEIATGLVGGLPKPASDNLYLRGKLDGTYDWALPPSTGGGAVESVTSTPGITTAGQELSVTAFPTTGNVGIKLQGLLSVLYGGTGASSGPTACANLGAALASTQVNGVYSITGGGDLSTTRSFALVGDAATPSPVAGMYYGTGPATTTKGWYTLPGGGGVSSVVSTSGITTAGQELSVVAFPTTGNVGIKLQGLLSVLYGGTGAASGPVACANIGAALASTQVNGVYSITGGGDLSTTRSLALVGDAATPSPVAGMYYGTGPATTTKGWYTLPGGGGGAVASVSGTVGVVTAAQELSVTASPTTGAVILRLEGKLGISYGGTGATAYAQALLNLHGVPYERNLDGVGGSIEVVTHPAAGQPVGGVSAKTLETDLTLRLEGDQPISELKGTGVPPRYYGSNGGPSATKGFHAFPVMPAPPPSPANTVFVWVTNSTGDGGDWKQLVGTNLWERQ